VLATLAHEGLGSSHYLLECVCVTFYDSTYSFSLLCMHNYLDLVSLSQRLELLGSAWRYIVIISLFKTRSWALGSTVTKQKIV
jgi:hypothetical protein